MSYAQNAGHYFARKRNRAATLSSNLSTEASGSISFASNPAINSSITLNGKSITFGNDVVIGANLAATLVNLMAYLDVSNDVNLTKATYGLTGTMLAIKSVARGVEIFTLAFSGAGITKSGATLVLPKIRQRVPLS